MLRLVHAFSKNLDHHRAAVALGDVHYNLCHVVKPLRVTPAVDEYGLPVARLTRSFGPNEVKVSALAQARMLQVLRHPELIAASSSPSLTFATDHQIGTCRMGDDPTRSVTNRFCRLHDVPNVFVVDTSFMPTGLGVNPMVSTMANMLRVGTWIAERSPPWG